MDEPTGAPQRRLAPPPGRQRGAALWLVLGLLPWLAAVALASLTAQWQLHAHPTGSQRSDRCATLTLGYDGQRQATGGTHCW